MGEKNNAKKITFGTYAVIVTIVFLVLLVGILAGMLIQKNQDEKVTNTTENVATVNTVDKENVVTNNSEEDIKLNKGEFLITDDNSDEDILYRIELLKNNNFNITRTWIYNWVCGNV